MDRLTAFRTFLAVVDEGGFAPAARALGISNAAASAHVRALEDRLGARLLTRTSRRVGLTDAGAVYCERIAAILADITAADEAVATLADEPRGRLRVTAPMSFGLLEITPWVPAFLARHPGVRLDLRLDDAALDVVGGGFDLAVRGHGALPDSSLVSRRLAALPIALCASPAYLASREPPATPEDLSAHPCLLYTHAARPGRWTLVRGEERRTVRVDGPYAGDGPEPTGNQASRPRVTGDPTCRQERVPRSRPTMPLASIRSITARLPPHGHARSFLAGVEPEDDHRAGHARRCRPGEVEERRVEPRKKATVHRASRSRTSCGRRARFRAIRRRRTRPRRAMRAPRPPRPARTCAAPARRAGRGARPCRRASRST